MNAQIPGQPLPPKKDRRETARESARQMREEQKKRESRNRWLLRGGIGLALVAIAAIVAVLIVSSVKPPSPGPLNMASDGVLMQGDGTAVAAVETKAIAPDAEPVPTDVSALADTVNITVYLDYLCPYCNQFEVTNSEQLTTWLTAGAITLETHPISILDNSSNGSKFSTRSANAAACVANYQPDSFLDVNSALFANQPAEGTSGLTDDELVSLVEEAGVTDESVATCITDQQFSDWVGDATDRALAGPLPNTELEAVKGTPTVLVQGVQYTGALDDAAAFETFVMQQAASTLEDPAAGTGE
jgi:protein-disulfide isomerase